MTLKKKEKEDDNQDEEEEEYEECHQRAGRQKQLLDVNFTFADSRRGFGQRTRPGGRGRGGDRDRGSSGNFERGTGRGSGGFRGGFRGSRGGSGDRGGYSRDQHDRTPRQSAPKVDDVQDFPALG